MLLKSELEGNGRNYGARAYARIPTMHSITFFLATAEDSSWMHTNTPVKSGEKNQDVGLG